MHSVLFEGHIYRESKSKRVKVQSKILSIYIQVFIIYFFEAKVLKRTPSNTELRDNWQNVNAGRVYI